MNGLGCKLLGAYAESRDDGANRIERDGQSWFRVRYHVLKVEGIAIDPGVVGAACKTLVAQRLKRSGMRWRIVGGQAVLTFRALIKPGLFDRAWVALMGAQSRPANNNISPTQFLQIAA